MWDSVVYLWYIWWISGNDPVDFLQLADQQWQESSEEIYISEWVGDCC
jgi:hypothetical protein